jgi:mono/diheme cytochrome c family protein
MKKRALLASTLAVSALALAAPRPATPQDAGHAAADVAPLGSVAVVSVLDLEGHVQRIGDTPVAVVFLGVDCPIANRSLPDLAELAKKVAVLGVYSGRGLTRAAVLEHRKSFSVAFPEIVDGSGELAEVFGPTVTPEAFLVKDGHVIYRGRIDDGYAAPGKPREQPGRRDLALAVDEVLAGKPVSVSRTEAVGCAFEAPLLPTDGTRPAVTYAREVASILGANCVMCHRPGGIAPFSLASYADASRHAKTCAQATASRFMPPWRAEPGFGDFEDVRRLTEREIQILAAWAAAGAPEGDPKETPPLPTFASGWQLGEPDLVVSMPRAFEVPASGPDLYRAFALTADLKGDEMVVAMEFRPGAPSVVHHCIVYLDASGAARKKEEAAGGFGYVSFGGPGFLPSGSLGGWAPGAMPRYLPDGMGRPLKKGSDVVLQIHYHPNGKAEKDQSRIGLYFAKKPTPRAISGTLVGTRAIDIPAGEESYVRDASLTLPVPFTLVGVTPHMHLLGHEMKVEAKLPSGEVVPLIWIKDWDFRWQDQYQYRSPVRLPAGTRIVLHAVYDNSASNISNPSSPPKRVKHGEQTTDEMCLCFFSGVTDSAADRRKLRAATVRGQIGLPEDK